MSSESEGKEQKDELLSKKACRRTTGPFGYCCCCCCCHSDCALHSLQIRLCKSPDSRISHQKYTCHAVMAPFLIETLISAHFLLFHFFLHCRQPGIVFITILLFGSSFLPPSLSLFLFLPSPLLRFCRPASILLLHFFPPHLITTPNSSSLWPVAGKKLLEREISEKLIIRLKYITATGSDSLSL